MKKTETDNITLMGVITSLKMVKPSLTELYQGKSEIETEYKIRILKITVNAVLRFR